MGMISKFLRVSGARAVVSLSKLRALIGGRKSELLNSIQDCQKNNFNRLVHQLSLEHRLNLDIVCFLAKREFNKPLIRDLVNTIASFLPVEFCDLHTVGEAQNEWKIHGYWYGAYMMDMRDVYGAMLIADESGAIDFTTFYEHKQAKAETFIEPDTALMSKLRAIQYTPNFCEDLSNAVEADTSSKRLKSMGNPKIEFQYEENCLFFIEFQRRGEGMPVGLVDYMHNMMRSSWQPVLWDHDLLEDAFSETIDEDEAVLDVEDWQEIDEIMSRIPLRLLSASVMTHFLCCSESQSIFG
jgi:hypothetical protein